MPKNSKSADHILPLYMNGLAGRMLKVPSSKGKKREILFIAGQHTSAERIYGMGEFLSRFGNVASPDLPGFGGMQPFYRIGRKPTMDDMADYIAAFIKLRYRNRRITIIAVSYGFAVITRMLQRYPEIVKKVDLLVSISGIVDKKDFRWKPLNLFLAHSGTWVFRHRTPAFLVKQIGLRPLFIKPLYRIVEKKHPKLKDANETDRAERINFELKLWKINDFRTWMETCCAMFMLDLSGTHVDLPVYHVAVDNDHYFDNLLVEQHMRAIYKDFELVKTKLPAHAPTVLATAKDVEPFVPPKIRKLLRKKPGN